MDDKELTNLMDTQRWLLDNGLVPEFVQNQLFFYGSIAHPEVQAVEVKIRPEVKTVDYTIFFTKKLLKKIETFNKLSTSTSLIGMWKFKRFLKKEGSLNFQAILGTFVKDFCGQGWSTKITITDFDVYIDNIGVDGEPDGSDQPVNKLPD